MSARRTVWITFLALALSARAANASPQTDVSSGGSPGPDTSVYIVELADEPLATYRGGISGLSATAIQSTGAVKLDTSRPNARAYAAHLEREQEALLKTVEGSIGHSIRSIHRYHNVLNGVALRLTADEAAAVAKLPEVAYVTRSFRLKADTDAGPAWIGATRIWDGSAVPGGTPSKGEGVVVGILDTGINMDHPSFAATGADGYTHINPFGDGNYKGFCNPEHEPYDPVRWPCNSKLVGAWSWPAAGDDPEDDGGHGTHTASTTAGNFVDAAVQAPTVAITLPLSGVAPHANIIAYDMAIDGWATIETMSAAVDQSVDDGVDVLNMSFGPDMTEADPWYDNHLYAKAYLNANAAGILASISAGNSGPGLATTASVAPWMPATAASTHNRVVLNSVGSFTGGSTPPPPELVGKGMTSGYGPAPIVNATGKLHADATVDDGRCLMPFAAGTFHGEIVVCVRGVIARVDKGANVLAGGAGGMVLANSAAEGSSTAGDAHVLPAVHIGYDDAQLLAAWMASGTGHMATISGMVFDRSDANGDILASFSSRGPTWMSTCCLRPTDIVDWEQGGFFGRRILNVLKPNVTAPGVDIWAAWATDRADPAPMPEYVAISGTSMASPHHAGAMALMRSVRPDWTPMEIESALMTTAVTDSVRKEDGITPATPFDMGAGRINVAAAVNAGFVLSESAENMAAASPMSGGKPEDLNLAGLANYTCLETCVFTRTLKTTMDEMVNWTATATGSDGLTLSVEPASFHLMPGMEATVVVTADVSAMEHEAFGFGRITFTPDNGDVTAAHFPVAVRAVDVVLPPAVISDEGSSESSDTVARVVIEASTPDGSATIPGWRMKGVDDLVVRADLTSGVAEAAEIQMARGPDDDPWAAGPATATRLFTASSHPVRLAAEIRSTSSPNVDLYMGPDLNGDGLAQEDEFTCSSLGAAWTEMCEIDEDIQTTSYWVLVHNIAAGDGTDTVDLRYGVAQATMTDSLHVTGPSSVESGEPFDLQVSWTYLDFNEGDVAYGRFFIQNDDGSETYVDGRIDIVRRFQTDRIFLPDVRYGAAGTR